MSDLEKQFANGLELAAAGKLAEAGAAFEKLVAADPQGDLADDGLYNIGLLAFRQNAFEKAEGLFRKLISEYPQATIAASPGVLEHGRTAAKAWLGLLNCALARGNEIAAWQALEELERFGDSWVGYTDGNGTNYRKTFAMLGRELLDRYAAAKAEMARQEK